MSRRLQGSFLLVFVALGIFGMRAHGALAASRSLSSGMVGSDVIALQQALIAKGYLASGSATGHFGPLTLAAVQKFQCKQGIVCSGASYGLVGPRTQAALGLSSSTSAATNQPAPSAPTGRSLSLGMSGNDVVALQQALIDNGLLAQGSATGKFGPLTLAGVKKFQCQNGIVCSGSAYGTAGPKTEAALGIGGSSAMEVVGWIPYWRANQGVADVLPHISQFTTIMPFGYTMMPDGTLTDAMNWGTDPWTTLASAAKQNGVKIIPTVMWSNGDAIYDVLSDDTSRQTLEDSVANVVDWQGFDGIDIDFEGKTAETKDYFSTFLKGLKTRLGNKLLYCTIEARTPLSELYDGMPPPGAGEYSNDFAAINTYCDRVQLMTYDQETADVALNEAASSSPYIPVSDPRWVQSVVNLTAQTISKSKLMIGVATYGYEWQVTPLAESGFRYDLQWAFDPGYAPQIEQQFGVIPVRNAAGELSIAYLPSMNTSTPPAGAEAASTTVAFNPAAVATTTYSDGSTMPSIAPSFNILWWSDAQAIGTKVALARQLGLKGIAIFKLDGGEDPNMWSVLPKAIH